MQIFVFGGNSPYHRLFRHTVLLGSMIGGYASGVLLNWKLAIQDKYFL